MPSRHYPGTLNERETISADTDPIDPNAGFMVDATGTLSCRLRNESADKDLKVNVGVFYPFDIAGFDKTGSTTVTTVVVFRGAPV